MHKSIRNISLCFITLVAVFSIFIIAASIKPAYAICASCGLYDNAATATKDVVEEQHEITSRWIHDEFNDWEEWLYTFLMPKFAPIWQNMSESITTTAMHQIATVGMFFDAAHQRNVQRLFQEKKAEIHKQYQPSHNVCKFGTITRSLAGSEPVTEIPRMHLNEWALDRQLGTVFAAGSEGNYKDRELRLEQFRTRYCDVNNNNMGYSALCAATPATPDTINRDIDFVRTISMKDTLDVDYTNTTDEPDEIDIFALSSNLYAHDIPPRIPETSLADSEAGRQRTLDIRALAAKRNVAQTSFNTIVGLKSPSLSPNLGQTIPYMNLLLEELGADPLYIADTLGTSPSYYAQMEVLTKRLYQSPSFYTNLYDKPANIERQKVAMQAIGLMQNFDLLQSFLRTEMMLSLILELEVMDLQETVQASLDRLSIRQ